jgi:hypothetical protein
MLPVTMGRLIAEPTFIDTAMVDPLCPHVKVIGQGGPRALPDPPAGRQLLDLGAPACSPGQRAMSS